VLDAIIDAAAVEEAASNDAKSQESIKADKEEADVSDLKEVDLEQAAEVGFLTVDGSPAFEEAINATKREEGSKFGGPTTEIFENGNQFNLTYTFEKPILFQGYMLQTSEDEPEWDPKSW